MWRLTQLGRHRARGERDPEQYWRRPWDGWWRQIVFDLPVAQQRVRSSLVRWLRRHGFGYLQDSVWISPDPIRDVAKALKRYRDDAASFTILECHCARGFTNGSLVKGAWPFDRINSGYQAYETFAKAQLRATRRSRLHPRKLFALLRNERELWQDAFAIDPLLPQLLLPNDYAGQRAWRLRQKLLTQLAARALAA